MVEQERQFLWMLDISQKLFLVEIYLRGALWREYIIDLKVYIDAGTLSKCETQRETL